MDSPDLGVSHEPVRESDGETVGLERGVRVVGGDGVHVGGVGVLNRVSLDSLLRGDTPTVVDTNASKEGSQQNGSQLSAMGGRGCTTALICWGELNVAGSGGRT